MLEAIAKMLACQITTAWLLLFLGDFFSTFLYHVPEHVFGKLHLQTHHSTQKDFRHYAVLRLNGRVLLDGILGALPYLLIAVLLWQISPIGVVLGLLLGQFHVWWRHTTALAWRTPSFVVRICRSFWVTTPEQHWLHHQKVTVAYGDIFTCFDQPARSWFRILRWLRLYWRYSFN